MNHLIEPEVLKDQLGTADLIIVDLCNPSLYQQQHVPGAIHLSGQHLIAGVPSSTRCLPRNINTSGSHGLFGYRSFKKSGSIR